jgi:type VI secretion system secreted protein Hcp
MDRIGRVSVLWLCVTTVTVAIGLCLPIGQKAFSQSDSADPDLLRAERYKRINQVLPELLDKLGPAQERDTAYVKIGDIKGGSLDTTHYEWIEALYIGYAISQNTISKAGRLSSKPDFSELTIIKDVDPATPYLAAACAKGKKIGQVEIHFTQALPDRRATYMRMVLKDVIVAGVTPMSIRGDGRSIHVEEVSLGYDRVEWEYTTFDERGRPRAPLSATADVK